MSTNENIIPFPTRQDETPPSFPIYGNRSKVRACLLVYGSGINRTFASGIEPQPDAMFTVPPGSDGLIWASLDGYCIAPMSVAWAAAPLPAFRFMLRRYWRRWLGLPSSPLGRRCPPATPQPDRALARRIDHALARLLRCNPRIYERWADE